MDHQPVISIVIVNYNVAYFLEQCLNAVFKALENTDGEVFVVDNDSIDGSVEVVRKKYPKVQLIANKQNVGFSKANNQAMQIAKGKYVLLLNPDTVVEEDTFTKCVSFMNAHPEAGGLGVRMIDGKGNFLPESKRGLPTPEVAFYKVFGISRLFPKTKRFGRYHLGFLDEFETNEIEVLSGAFMLMRKEALDKIGLLDEAFFMYGEDIDLSYRITQGGYKNYYFPETQIIHYKGESTKKSSVNYVFVFYRAMIIFAQKHFSQKNAKLFSFLINGAIYFRASLALFSRFVKRAFLPTLDFAVIVAGLILMTKIWEHENIAFPENILRFAVPSYGLTWMLSVFYAGGYDKPIKLISYIKGALFGTGVILMIYALLPKTLQFSRLYILLGAAMIVFYYIVSRIILHFTFKGSFDLKGVKNKNFGVVGTHTEVDRVKDILKHSTHNVSSVFSISPSRGAYNKEFTGSLEQLDQVVHIHDIHEVIFCAKDVSAEAIIKWMSKIRSSELEFKIAQPDSVYLIGSNSVDTAGDLYVLEIDKISKPKNKRYKRTFDVVFGVLLLIVAPFICWFYCDKKQFFKNIFGVVFGYFSLVGYHIEASGKISDLPRIKTGVLTPINKNNKTRADKELLFKLNLIYARDYSILKDFEILSKNLNKLDR